MKPGQLIYIYIYIYIYIVGNIFRKYFASFGELSAILRIFLIYQTNSIYQKQI